VTEEKPAKLTEEAEGKAADLTEEAKQWLADQQRFYADFYEKYYGKEDGPDQPEALPAQRSRSPCALTGAPLPLLRPAAPVIARASRVRENAAVITIVERPRLLIRHPADARPGRRSWFSAEAGLSRLSRAGRDLPPTASACARRLYGVPAAGR
jgi:hypothetical protein